MRRPSSKPLQRDLSRKSRQGSHLTSPFEASILVDYFRSHLKQVVSIHRVMFEKLLFEEDSDVGPELAELFEDAGKTYLKIAQRISERCLSRQVIQD
jgi:hypothetical protein